jgi:putative membrane protein
MWGEHWMFGGFMWVFWIAVLVALFFLIKWMVQQKPGYLNPDEDALEVLKKRYAKGEIDKEEFEQKKKDLLA